MIKILVNRKEPSRQIVASHRDFVSIMNRYHKRKIYQNPWFYGVVGFSSIAGLLFFCL